MSERERTHHARVLHVLMALFVVALCAAVCVPQYLAASATPANGDAEAQSKDADDKDSQTKGTTSGTEKAADDKDSDDKDSADKDSAASAVELSEEALALIAAEAPDWAQAPYDDCTACHSTNVVDSADEESCLYSKHTIVPCYVCHDDEKLVDVHAEGDMSKVGTLTKLVKTKVSPELCVVCHDADGLAELTEDCVALTDVNGTTVNPHDLPVNVDHQSLNCMTCHKFHDTDDYDLAATAKRACISCHHENVFECNTCHL